MTSNLRRLMQETLDLTRAGRLQEATDAIRSALGGGRGTAATPAPAARLRDDVIDIKAQVIHTEPVSPTAAPEAPAQADHVAGAHAALDGSFLPGQHTEAGLTRGYKLYVPPGAEEQPLPLVVMLHGCTQDPDDFAAGTAMNELAGRRGCYVLYPAQSADANPNRCWNWFKHNHQARGHGEPALIAGMTRAVMARYGIDARRVYVAGLSAGGAMAAIVAQAYPTLFAAVGVHSGLAAGASRDLMSALSAMKDGAAAVPPAAAQVPTIVFHGDADGTVNPRNGTQVAEAALAGTASVARSEEGASARGRRYTRTRHLAPDGRTQVEHWTVHGGAHAWAGGRSIGSYTDPAGPDASAEMLRFFDEHPMR